MVEQSAPVGKPLRVRPSPRAALVLVVVACMALAMCLPYRQLIAFELVGLLYPPGIRPVPSGVTLAPPSMPPVASVLAIVRAERQAALVPATTPSSPHTDGPSALAVRLADLKLDAASLGDLPERLTAVRDHWRAAGADPGLAAVAAREQVIPPYVQSLRQAIDGLEELGHARLAAGHMTEAETAYRSAAALAEAYAIAWREADFVLLAAQVLPKLYGELADIGVSRSDGSGTEGLRAAAKAWSQLSADWREAADRPPHMLPRTDSGAFWPDAQRSVLVSLVQVGVTMVGLAYYWVTLLLVALGGLVAAARRRPAVPMQWAGPRAGWLIAAAWLGMPIAAGCCLLMLAGSDWAWLLSVRLVVAVALLVCVADGVALWSAVRLLLRCPADETAERRRAWRRALALAVLLLLASTAVALWKPGDARQSMVPATIDRTVLLAWVWFAAVLLFGAGTLCMALVRRVFGSARAASGNGWLLGRRRRATLTLAALGLMLHATLLSLLLARHARLFMTHSRQVAATVEDAPAHWLGDDWRTRVPASATLN